MRKQKEYFDLKRSNVEDDIDIELDNISDETVNVNVNGHWPKGTTVIMGDSIINGINEQRLSKNGSLVKVRHYPGASVDCMRYNIMPIFKKDPSNMIIHIGTKSVLEFTSTEILNKVLKLKTMMKEKLPHYNVLISVPTLRLDDGKATLTISQLTNHLLELNIPLINNKNITSKHLSKKGLHLNGSGTRRLARNFLDTLKIL